MNTEIVAIEQPVRASRVPLLPIAVALVPALTLLLAVLWETDGNFTYTMDDPYIHLTLARNIWHGHYGINPGEFTAPASSILWPFLITPFSELGSYFEYVPLLLNLICLTGTALLLNRILRALEVRWRTLLCFLVLFSLNVYGIVFTGMEHSLQALLVLVVLSALLGEPLGAKNGSRLTFWTVVSLIALPLVRYEDLAIAIPACIYFYVKGERKLALVSLAAILVSVGLFSLFLYSRGLGVLVPLSVLVKAPPTSTYIFKNLLANLGQYGFILLPAVCLFYYYRSHDAHLAVVLVVATVLHFVLGHYGWVGRYEVYYLVFVVVMLMRVTAVDLRPTVLVPALFLPCCFWSLVTTTLTTPLGAANIYHQQAQMAAIARMLDEPIAVNDLGLVSFRSGQYILDLAGLASPEAFRAWRSGRKQALWVDELMRSKGVRYASIYTDWFSSLPASWSKVGALRLLETRITPDESVISFYATSPATAEHLRATLQNFAARNHSSKYDVVVY